eukprot:s2113_g4.t1
MPPKIRRPAVAPKAKVRGDRRGRRRPAAREDRDDSPSKEVIQSAQVTLEQCRELDEIEVVKGSYWESEVQAVLKVREAVIRQGELFLKAQVMGTQNESLLRAASNRPDRDVEAHLCPRTCTGGPHAEGVVHVSAFRKLGREREPWMTNMVPEEKREAVVPRPPDELGEIRADMQRLQGPLGKGMGDDKGKASPASDSDEKKDKKRKRSKSKRRRKKEWKVEGQKEIKALFAKTGMDLDPSVRKRFRRRASRIAQKKGKDSKGSSSSSSSTSEEVEKGDATLFGSSSRVQVIGKRLPGTLAASALEEVAESLVDHEGGLWETQSGPLPALFSRYFKQQLTGRMAPPMARETMTLCHAADLLMRGRTAEALDVLAQRIKALELQSTGVHYTVSQQQELLAREVTSISSTPELFEAAKRAREEGRVRADAARPYGARSQAAPKAEESQKGWPRKGAGKSKGSKGDQKKGDAEKAEKGKPKGREPRGTVAAERIDRQLICGSPDHDGGSLLGQPSSCQTRVGCKTLDELRLQDTPAGVQACKGSVEVLDDHMRSPGESHGHYEAPAKLGAGLPCSTVGPEDRALKFAGKVFADLGGSLNEALQQLLWEQHGKVLTMAVDKIYPLPLGDYPGIHPSRTPWMSALLQALNSLYGCPGPATQRPTEVQKELVLNLSKFVDRMWAWEDCVPTAGFGAFFDVKGVDYRGEEIKLARPFTWDSISGALPRKWGLWS